MAAILPMTVPRFNNYWRGMCMVLKILPNNGRSDFICNVLYANENFLNVHPLPIRSKKTSGCVLGYGQIAVRKRRNERKEIETI